MNSNSTWVITALHIGGGLLLFFGGITLVASFSEGKGINGLLGGVIAVGAAIPFFFFAQVLQNLLEQTELLKEIKLSTSKIKNPEELSDNATEV